MGPAEVPVDDVWVDLETFKLIRKEIVLDRIERHTKVHSENVERLYSLYSQSITTHTKSFSMALIWEYMVEIWLVSGN